MAPRGGPGDTELTAHWKSIVKRWQGTRPVTFTFPCLLVSGDTPVSETGTWGCKPMLTSNLNTGKACGSRRALLPGLLPILALQQALRC